MLQNATNLRKCAPWPLNIFDEHVYRTVPHTRHASLQIPFKCPMPTLLKLLPNPRVLLIFDKVQNPLRLPRISTSLNVTKSAPNPSFSGTFDIEMCFAPQRGSLFRCINFQKWSDTGLPCAFWLGDVLRATTAHTFSTSQGAGNGVLCTFWLGNVLRAKTACTFSTSQLPKVLWTCVLCAFWLRNRWVLQRRTSFRLSSRQLAPHMFNPPKHMDLRLFCLFVHLHLAYFLFIFFLRALSLWLSFFCDS